MERKGDAISAPNLNNYNSYDKNMFFLRVCVLYNQVQCIFGSEWSKIHPEQCKMYTETFAVYVFDIT